MKKGLLIFGLFLSLLITVFYSSIGIWLMIMIIGINMIINNIRSNYSFDNSYHYSYQDDDDEHDDLFFDMEVEDICPCHSADHVVEQLSLCLLRNKNEYTCFRTICGKCHTELHRSWCYQVATDGALHDPISDNMFNEISNGK